MGPENALYGWTAHLWPFDAIPEAHEQAIGLGLVTTALLACAAYQNRHAPRVRLALIVAFVLALALTSFPFEVRLWRLWYYTVPGLGSVRAVSRLGLFLVVPAAIALGHFVHSRKGRSRAGQIGTIAIALFCLAEQTRHGPFYDKSAWQCEITGLASQVDREADAFHLLGGYGVNLKALAVSQRAGIPTTNFVGGAFPMSWTLFDTHVRDGHSNAERSRALDAYLAEQRVDGERVQRITPGTAGGLAERCR